jgi:BirA family biotin operon repressor/biotin-[acetyl-CoA-carboxylase] ligase
LSVINTNSSKLHNLLSSNLQTILNAPLIELSAIDSTNNYAMGLIDDGSAQPGLTITANEQTKGKGQRGKKWEGTVGENLLMSIILEPVYPIEEQFLFSANIAAAIANVLQNLNEQWNVQIKWPNDIIINDKKAGGILIENVIRGNTWSYSIIGFGLNVLQYYFPNYLPFATSLRLASGKTFSVIDIRDKLRHAIIEQTFTRRSAQEVMGAYNNFLFRKDKDQLFSDGIHSCPAVVKEATPQGQLRVQLADGTIAIYTHGSVTWEWR